MLGKRQRKEVSATIVEVVGSAPSDFARKQLEKFGWKECVAALGRGRGRRPRSRGGTTHSLAPPGVCVCVCAAAWAWARAWMAWQSI